MSDNDINTLSCYDNTLCGFVNTMIKSISSFTLSPLLLFLPSFSPCRPPPSLPPFLPFYPSFFFLLLLSILHLHPPTGEAILPIPRSSTEMWRMIHFKYKKNRVISHVVDGYDITTTKHSQDYVLTRIPRESICVGIAGSDPALVNATLEVGLNNPILEAGFEIICSPTSDPGSLEAVRRTLQVCQVELHPFFIYSHDGKSSLSQQVSARFVCLFVLFCFVLPLSPTSGFC